MSSDGVWASAKDHERTMTLMPSKSRRRCHCGCGTRATHVGRARNVPMMSGCEFFVRRWVKDYRAGPAGTVRAITEAPGDE